MRRGRHNPTGFRTDAEAAQQAAEPAGATPTRAGEGGTPAMGTGADTVTATGPAATRAYERGAAPTAPYGREVAGGAGADTMAGGVLSILAGLLTFLAGLAVLVRQSFYPPLTGYAYSWNIGGWGIVLLVLGVLLFAAGACALLGMGWARAAAVGVAVLTAVAGFLFLAYAPVWGVIIVAVSVVAIWGLLRDGAGRRARV